MDKGVHISRIPGNSLQCVRKTVKGLLLQATLFNCDCSVTMHV